MYTLGGKEVSSDSEQRTSEWQQGGRRLQEWRLRRSDMRSRIER